MTKRPNTLLRLGELLREEDSAIEFWRLKHDLQNKFENSQYWSDDVWKSEATRKYFNIVLIRQDKKFFTFELSKVIQEAIPLILSIPNNLLECTYHIGCAINLHSITNSGLIPGGQNSDSDRQTIFFTAANPCIRIIRTQELDLTKSRLASYKQKWKVHQDTAYWVDFQFAQRKGFKFYQTRSNAAAYCISKAIVMKSEEIIYQKVYVSPPTISYKDNWTCNLDSDVAESSKHNQRIELKPNTQFIKYRETCFNMECRTPGKHQV